MIVPKTTFEVGKDEHGQYIRCLVCKRRSYNPNDIQHRYCGACHQYHPITCNVDPS